MEENPSPVKSAPSEPVSPKSAPNPVLAMLIAVGVKIFDALCSLKLAVFTLLGIAGCLATATFMESLYDTPTAQFYVYRSFWFSALLGLLGVNIFCTAMSRYPWKWRHTPFLLAHVGILTLLYGSWVTQVKGLDGSLRVGEGEATSVVEMSNPTLAMSEGADVQTVEVTWMPPQAKFKPIEVPKYALTIDEFISHAEAVVTFAADPAPPTKASSPPDAAALAFRSAALKITLAGGPMKIVQDYWLWSADPTWRNVQAGPSRLMIVPTLTTIPDDVPWFMVAPSPDGGIDYRVHARGGKTDTAHVTAAQLPNLVLHPGWRGNVTITLKEWLPRAASLVSYKPAALQYGEQAPQSAIHLRSGDGAGRGAEGAGTWLGIGDRASLQYQGRDVAISYQNEKLSLPFAIRLEHFKVDHYEGTNDPSEFSSQVRVIPRAEGHGDAPMDNRVFPLQTISMNEPLKHDGITFYQASYEDAQPRPTTSILSVNRDPGRPLKYAGSLFIVLGTISLFANRFTKKRSAPRVASSEVSA